jgi:hypothetical protein
MQEWVKHEEAKRWCSVLRRDHSAILTRCRGSLDECEPHTITERPAVADRCVACQRAFAAAELEAHVAAEKLPETTETITFPQPLASTDSPKIRAAMATMRDRTARDYIENRDYVPGEDW